MRLRAHGGDFALSLVLASSFFLAVMVALQTMAPR
jgi:hypothetical protein